jgi:hypothetical protein
MKRRWLIIILSVAALVLGTGALTGGLYLAHASGDFSAEAQEYYYGPVNCHASPVLPNPTGDRKQYADYLVNTIAPHYHLEAAVLLWQVQQESGFNPNAYSSAGAIGIAQFMPSIAAAYGINPWDPWQSLDGMARYDLASLRAFWDESHTIAVRFGGNRNSYAWGMALAAYNAGGPNTGRALTWADQHDWSRGPWTWLWWFGDANQTFYYVPDILGCESVT